ncbi:MAG TPA: SOS response-associated peptidase [Gammaproteobacteria bacterium]|nr:SOS response-associated peptidase [Gammaproteobacteria bacterium]
MCGRYLTPEESAFERYWNLKAPAGYRRSYNVAPSQQAPVILRKRDGERAAELFAWGFRPPWAQRTWINARSETVFTAKAFASAAEQRRCLVPALGWYEWKGEKAPKQPFLHHRGELEPIALAGIWTGTRTDEGWKRSFAILTRPAIRPLLAIHDRMPAVIEPDDYEAWLAADTSPADALSLLLGGEPDIEAYPISPYVNKPEHDDAGCIEPLVGGEAS